MNDLILKIAKEMKLDAYTTDMLIHDVNNGRGHEQLEEIMECCSIETFKEFYKAI